MGLEGMGMGMGLKGMQLLGRPGLKRETWPVWSETEDNESSPITATRRGLVRGDRRPSCRVPRTSPPEGAARDRLSWNVHQEEGLAFASSPAPANARWNEKREAMGGWAAACLSMALDRLGHSHHRSRQRSHPQARTHAPPVSGRQTYRRGAAEASGARRRAEGGGRRAWVWRAWAWV